MLSWLVQSKSRVNFRLTAMITLAAFCISIFTPEIFRLTPSATAAVLPYMAEPTRLLSTTASFKPVNLKGLKVYPDDPFKFDFLIDEGQVVLKDQELQAESSRLIRYFLAGLTIPKEDLWVNLSPYEHERVVPQALGETDAGRDLLGEDYVLKQLTASLIYPESMLGKKFWEKIRAKAQELYGASNIPVDTFNKIWIIPGKITVYEDNNTAIIGEAKLKVMMEQDYLALQKAGTPGVGSQGFKAGTPGVKANNDFATQIMKEVVLPAIEQEVNSGKQFAILRQVYHALILANWLKLRLAGTLSTPGVGNQRFTADTPGVDLLQSLYIDQRKIAGVNVADPAIKEKIYQQYVRTVQKGVYKYMRHESDPFSGKKVWRQYYSGGADFRKNLTPPSQKLDDQPEAVQAAVKAGKNTIVPAELDTAGESDITQQGNQYSPASGVEKTAGNVFAKTGLAVLGMFGLALAGQSGDQHTAVNVGLILAGFGTVATTAFLFARNMLAGAKPVKATRTVKTTPAGQGPSGTKILPADYLKSLSIDPIDEAVKEANRSGNLQYALDSGGWMTWVRSSEQIYAAPGMVSRNAFKNKFNNGEGIFDWLMQNDYFQETRGVKGQPRPIDGFLETKLKQQYPVLWPQILTLLRHRQGYKIHVAMDAQNAKAVLEVVLPMLRAKNFAHKTSKTAANTARARNLKTSPYMPHR